MIRSSPCEFYVKYLVTKPERMDNGAIRRDLEEKGLDLIGGWYLDEWRVKCRPPTPFYPADRRHSPSQRFLLRERIVALYHPDEDMRAAWNLLRTKKAREFTESMLLSGAPGVAIAEVLKDRFRVYASEAVVAKFKHFFWNIDLIDSTEIRTILRMRVENLAGHPDPDVRKSYESFKNASYKDPRRTASDLPDSPLTAVLAQLRLGILPKTINTAMVLSRIRELGASRAVEAIINGGPKDAESAALYMNSVKAAVEVLEGMATPEQTLLKQLQKFKLKTEDAPVPSIHDLSGGNHTADLLAHEENEEDSAEKEK